LFEIGGFFSSQPVTSTPAIASSTFGTPVSVGGGSKKHKQHKNKHELFHFFFIF